MMKCFLDIRTRAQDVASRAVTFRSAAMSSGADRLRLGGEGRARSHATDNDEDRSMPDIKPCLWFQSEAEEAANFYTATFPNSRVATVMRGGPGAPVIAVDFVLDGRPALALNGRQEAGFTDAHSIVVTCETQAEIDRYWSALTEGGEESRCGWLTDRYGVSWQIVPRNLGDLLGGHDPAASARAMQALLGMQKLDLAALERARAGA
jgi:predicted 3-demethylubiquinone-9 3-methyltransferase (glyoxalase superfamily)